MKHLISFSESNKYLTIKNLVEDIKDICLDMIDVGFFIKVEPDNDTRLKVLSLKSDEVFTNTNIPFYIDINKGEVRDSINQVINNRIFNIDEIKDTLIRIVEYMRLNGYVCTLEIPYPGRSGWRNIKLSMEMDDGTIITRDEFPDIGHPTNLSKVRLSFEKIISQ